MLKTIVKVNLPINNAVPNTFIIHQIFNPEYTLSINYVDFIFATTDCFHVSLIFTMKLIDFWPLPAASLEAATRLRCQRGWTPFCFFNLVTPGCSTELLCTKASQPGLWKRQWISSPEKGRGGERYKKKKKKLNQTRCLGYGFPAFLWSSHFSSPHVFYSPPSISAIYLKACAV